jgi:arylsulfatase/uncharacterized sulfatase
MFKLVLTKIALMLRFLFFGILCLTYQSMVLSQLSKDDNSHERSPNIVLILVDDAALQDFGIYGGEAATPHIDALAHQGTLFTQYRASLMCAPSRAMLMTGYDSHLTGVPNLPIFTPPEYASRPGYEGILNDKVETIATRLKRQGYRTYITGKWHLGHTDATLPSRRGFDRTYILDASGADNYQHRPYLPTQSSKPPWYKDGELVDLPDDFYSSKNLVDEMIQFMDEEDQKEDPFFSFISFQAIHIPVQAPKEYTERYIETYEQGWDVIKKQRFEKAKQLGLIPEQAAMGTMPRGLENWDDLELDQQRFMAKAMAVNAGMLEAMDEHIGRYINYLKQEGKYDNTVFMITSDNGPEASATGDVRSMQLWLKYAGYNRDYDSLGEEGSYNFIGPEFASACAGPSSFFKFYAGEGGLRVPLIISGNGLPHGESENAFCRVTDIAPTILSLAGISSPKLAPAGPMTGKSLYPLLQNTQEQVYEDDEPIGIEAAGHGALYKGDYKIVRNGRPYGDGEWRLHNLSVDPGETTDLSKTEPNKFAEMIRDYDDYTKAYGVLEMGINYEPLNEIQNKMVARIGKAIRPWLAVIGVGLVLLFGYRAYRRKAF